MKNQPVLLLSLVAALLTGGCSVMGGSSEAPVLYAPVTRIQPDPAWPRVAWRLALAPATAPALIEDERIMVSPTPGELQLYRGARWANAPTGMVEDAVLQTLEASEKIASVGRQGNGMMADYRLLLEVRSFRSDYAGTATPSALVEVNAKLLDVAAQRIVADRSFRQQQAAAGTSVGQVSEAFALALGGLGHDIAGWALTMGDARAAKTKP